MHGKKECKKCMKLISKTNIARHRLSCQASKQELTEIQTLAARVYKAQRKQCNRCDKMITVANMAKQQESKACLLQFYGLPKLILCCKVIKKKKKNKKKKMMMIMMMMEIMMMLMMMMLMMICSVK